MNWDKIEQLLNIVESSIKHGTPLRPIHDAAMKELHEYAWPKIEVPEPKVEAEVESEDNGKLKRITIDG